jgi:NAD(P)H dehydrogenase (quinone)
MPFVITATSGHLGRLVVQELLRRGVPADQVVAGARNPDAIADLAADGVRTARIDYDDPGTIKAALSPGDTFVLVSGNDLANRDRQHAEVIAAAERAGAGHLVYTSALHADSSPSPIAASHAPTEQVVRASGLPHTILRMGWYTENYQGSVPSVQATGVLLSSVGDGRVASATRQDLAEAIGVVLTSDGHTGKTYELSGDTAWSYDDLAGALAEVLDRDVTHQSLSPEQHVQALTVAGLPPEVAQMVAGVDAGIAAGAFAHTDGDLSRLLGRPTTPLVDGLRPLVPTNP